MENPRWKRKAESGKRKTERGKRKTERGKRKAENGKRKAERETGNEESKIKLLLFVSSSVFVSHFWTTCRSKNISHALRYDLTTIYTHAPSLFPILLSYSLLFFSNISKYQYRGFRADSSICILGKCATNLHVWKFTITRVSPSIELFLTNVSRRVKTCIVNINYRKRWIQLSHVTAIRHAQSNSWLPSNKILIERTSIRTERYWKASLQSQACHKLADPRISAKMKFCRKFYNLLFCCTTFFQLEKNKENTPIRIFGKYSLPEPGKNTRRRDLLEKLATIGLSFLDIPPWIAC